MLKNVLRSQGYIYLHTAIEAFIFVATIPIIFHDTFPRWNLKFHRSSFAIYGLTPFFPCIPSNDQFVIMLCKHFSNKKKKRKWKEEVKEKERGKIKITLIYYPYINPLLHKNIQITTCQTLDQFEQKWFNNWSKCNFN